MPRAPVSPSKKPAKPLIVRLRNWVGDVVLGVPLLRLLESQGYALHLLGKRWAQDLLQGEGWLVEPLAHTWSGRVAQLQSLRRLCSLQDPQFKQSLNALALPFSFSSALEMRWAGLRPVGVAHEGRGMLLAKSLAREAGLHELESYWRLASPFMPTSAPLPQPPQSIDLKVSAEHQRAAQALCLAHRLSPGFIMLCPFAGGTYDKKPKTWPHFLALSQALRSSGRPLVLCPGPGEESIARQSCPDGLILAGVNLGVYAAFLQRAALMISNDTGPGHLAAAVGTPILSVLGPTLPSQWRPWGEQVICVQAREAHSWPDVSAVLNHTQHLLNTSTAVHHE